MERSADELMFDLVDAAFLHGREHVTVAVESWLCCGVWYVDKRPMARVACPHCRKGALLISSKGE